MNSVSSRKVFGKTTFSLALSQLLKNVQCQNIIFKRFSIKQFHCAAPSEVQNWLEQAVDIIDLLSITISSKDFFRRDGH